MNSPSIIWFRDDLRLADNPALSAAVSRGEPVTAVYIWDEQTPGIRALGGAARWWLHHSLSSLSERLKERGVQLVLRRGAATGVLAELVHDVGAGAVFWNRRYGLPEREVDAGLKSKLSADGVKVESFQASLLHEPWTVRTGTNTHYSVYTPFWKACQNLPAPRPPLAEPATIPGTKSRVSSDSLEQWELLPTTPDWAGGLRESWEPGEPAALQRLQDFLEEDGADYERSRDEPSRGGTSLLSPHLRWGEISPFTAWHATIRAEGSPVFLAELGWREFAWHTLFHFPDLARRNLRSEYDHFPWPELDPESLSRWQQGTTGIPLVDAGMRELWHTGYMHNRVRMVTASFLIKNLLVHWREGEQWFWDTLVDADAASNPFNWQWAAGSGADAAPYFRVFNPELQAKKFDPQGKYISRWGADFTAVPMVDLALTRKRALEAYDRFRHASRPAQD